jgi:hypothetical protein
MTRDEVIAKLKERPKTAEEGLEALKTEWKQALDNLFKGIESWLEPAIQAGVLKASRSSTDLLEEDLGTYLVPILRITDGRATVRIEPIGARVVGVLGHKGVRLGGLRGRVDLICGPIKIPLVRTSANVWKALPLRGEPVDLNSESFFELLGEVLLDE